MILEGKPFIGKEEKKRDIREIESEGRREKG